MATRKTILTLEVFNNTWHLKYSGSIEEPKEKEQFKHDERIMRALMSSDELLNLFLRLTQPVVRCKRREARKKAKSSTSH